MTAPDPAEVLKGILADPEFETGWREDLGRRIEWLWRAFSAWVDRLSFAERGLILVLCLLCLTAIGWSVVLGFREGAERADRKPERAKETAPASPAGDLAERARALAGEGRLREAARTLQQAVYRALADRARLSWDGARADWEWVARLGGDAELGAFTAQAQLAAYGAMLPDSSGFESLWASSLRWVAS